MFSCWFFFISFLNKWWLFSTFTARHCCMNRGKTLLPHFTNLCCGLILLTLKKKTLVTMVSLYLMQSIKKSVGSEGSECVKVGYTHMLSAG